MAYCVYCHTSPDGKKYVGCTRTEPEKRFRGGLGYEKNPRFWSDICKFGWDAFQHEILYDELDEDAAYKIESELIDELCLLNPERGYNLYDGKGGRSDDTIERVRASHIGNTNCEGRVLSQETKKKISESLKAYNATHDNPFFGRHHKPETIEKLRNREISEETRRKLRENCSVRYGTDNTSARPVMQFTKDGEFIERYPYASIASKKYGIDLSSLIKCCRGKAKSAGGFVWKYTTD